MIYLYGIVIPEIIASYDYECMFQSISKERQLRIHKFYMEMDKKRSLFAELLLKYILDMHLSIGEAELSFENNKYGKPRLSDYPNVYFNYSHSGNWVLCAVGECPIGVDVEQIKKRDMDIAKRFYTAEEYEYIQARTEEEQNECFYKIWTLKESYIKAKGKGLSIPLNSFSFHLREHIELKIEDQMVGNYIFWSDKLDKDHAAALCYESSVKGESDIIINTISYETILEWLKIKKDIFKEEMPSSVYILEGKVMDNAHGNVLQENKPNEET